jgi:hypothetical protein
MSKYKLVVRLKMITEYICNECKFIWRNDSKIEFVRICPKCRSYNIQFNTSAVKNFISDTSEANTQENISRKLKIHEYIVPWMIEI